MVHGLDKVIEVLAVTGAASSITYYTLCLRSAAAFLRERKADEGVGSTFTPPVSILKPLRGTDPEMYESFRSHCLQDYPEYEIIFGVSDASDPAIELVEQLKVEFPQHAIHLTVCRESLGTNTKVSNLAQMVREARHEYLIVNDSDIRVEPDYLRRVLAPLTDPKVGLVTCLYRGVANSTFGSRLESFGISTDFSAGVLVAQNVDNGIRFGLGSTLAFRRHDLQAIGGFEAIVDYLADDYQLGSRIADVGFKVKLSDVVVETFLPRYTFRSFAEHQLRWARTVRDSRFWGYVGLGLTFGLPWATLALILARGAAWAWALLACTVVMRIAVAVVVGKLVLRDRQVLGSLAFIPVRDLIALLVWIASFAGHKIVWRGNHFRLENGRLKRSEPMSARTSPPVRRRLKLRSIIVFRFARNCCQGTDLAGFHHFADFSCQYPQREWLLRPMFQRLMSSVLSLALLTLAPALAQENKFAGRLLPNRYQLNFQDGRLSGTGLPVRQNALASTQFVLIGEDHGISQIPQFAGAVCDLIGPQGFHTMAIETGPLAANELQQWITRASGRASLVDFEKKFPESIAFYNFQEEYDLLSHCARSAQGGKFQLWGLDQELMGSSGLILTRILETHPGKQAQTKRNACCRRTTRRTPLP